MPARNATQATLDAAKAAQSEQIHLFEAILSAPIYATDAPFSISWNAQCTAGNSSHSMAV